MQKTSVFAIFAFIILLAFSHSIAGMIKITLENVDGIGTLKNWKHMAHSKTFDGCSPCHRGKVGKKGELIESMTKEKKYIGCHTGLCHEEKKGHKVDKLKNLAETAGLLEN